MLGVFGYAGFKSGAIFTVGSSHTKANGHVRIIRCHEAARFYQIELSASGVYIENVSNRKLWDSTKPYPK